MNKIFNCVSVIFHPLFAVTFGVLLIMGVLLPGLNQSLILLLLFSAGYTVALPLLFIGVAWKLGFVSQLKMPKRGERTYALATTAICTYFFGHALGGWHAPVTMQVFVMGAAIMMTVAALLALFSRISLHTIGWGGLTALVSYLSFSYSNLSIALALTVLVSGLVATARLRLDEHAPSQVYAGFIVGYITIWITFIISSLW